METKSSQDFSIFSTVCGTTSQAVGLDVTLLHKLFFVNHLRFRHRSRARKTLYDIELGSVNEATTEPLESAPSAFNPMRSLYAYKSLPVWLLLRSASLTQLPCRTARHTSRLPLVATRTMASTSARGEKFAPAKRVAGRKQDVW